MNMCKKVKWLLGGVGIVFAVVLSCMDGAVASEAEVRLEPVTVTAEKRSEDVQDIPSSVSVMTDTEIEEAGITRLDDLTARVPNMAVHAWGIRGQTNLYVRGVGAAVNNPAIALYVDGVGYMDDRGFDMDLFDLERIEVLRGPQGTLYGRNTLGGVMNIITRQPDNETNVAGKGTVGTYGTYEAMASLRTPLVEDTLFLGLSGGFEGRDGYIQNEQLDTDADFREGRHGRAQLRWTPTDKLDVSLTVDGERLRDGAYPMAPLDSVNSGEINQDFEGSYHRDQFGVSASMAYKADDWTFTSITAGRKLMDSADNDQDFSAFDLLNVYEDVHSSQLSQELRLASPDDDGPTDWLVGAYAFHSTKDSDIERIYGSAAGGLATLGNTTDSDQTSMGVALFGQVTHTIFDKLDLTGGLRLDYENNSIDLSYVDTTGMSANSAFDASVHNVAWLPKAQVAYRFTPDVMAYAGVTRGYKAGGFDRDGSVSKAGFDPEYSWNYELGFKSSWLDNRLNLNAALFYIDLQDQQVYQTTAALVAVTTNAGKSRSMGVELESEFLINQYVSLEAGVGYTHARFTNYEDSGADYAGNHIPMTPDYTFNVALPFRYALEEASGSEKPLTLLLRPELKGIGPSYWDTANNLKEGAYTLANLRCGLETENFDLVFWGKNLAGTKYNVIALEASEYAAFGLPTRYGELGAPRTFGVTVTARF